MIKRWCLLFIILCIPLIVIAQQFTAECEYVIDGDTIEVIKDGQKVTIRLDGIDCPELAQDFGSKAKRFTSSLVFNKNVVIEETDVDKYGRTVARVIVGGKDVSLELVKAGLAWFYREYSRDTLLANAERIAQENEDGLWAMVAPEAPWTYRHDQNNLPQGEQVGDSTVSDSDLTVYVTNTGQKYHSAGCRYLKSQIPMSINVAIADGYTPCSLCGGKGASTQVTSKAATLPARSNGNDPAVGSTATGKTIYEGPRGGKYHISKSGKKVYEKKKKP